MRIKNKMGIIKNLICIAILLVGIAFIFGITKMSDEQYDCLEEIAEDYCEDNGMEFERVLIFNQFSCKEDERAIGFEIYKFLEDEVEDCGELK